MPKVREILEGLVTVKESASHVVDGSIEVKEDSFFEKFVSIRYGSINTPWKSAVIRRALAVSEHSRIRGEDDFRAFRLELADFVLHNREQLPSISLGSGEAATEDVEAREKELVEVEIRNSLTTPGEDGLFTGYKEGQLSLLNILRDAELLKQRSSFAPDSEIVKEWDRIVTLAARVTRLDIIDAAENFSVAGSDFIDQCEKGASKIREETFRQNAAGLDGSDQGAVEEALRAAELAGKYHYTERMFEGIKEGKFGQGAIREFWVKIAEKLAAEGNAEYDQYLTDHADENDLNIAAAQHVTNSAFTTPEQRHALYYAGVLGVLTYNRDERQESGIIPLGESNDLVRSLAIAIQYKKAFEAWEGECVSRRGTFDFDIANYPQFIVRRADFEGDEELIPGAIVIEDYEELLRGKGDDKKLSDAEVLSQKVADRNRIIAQAVLFDRYKRIGLSDWPDFDYEDFCRRVAVSSGLQEEIMMAIAQDRYQNPDGNENGEFVPEDGDIDEYEYVAFSNSNEFSHISRTQDQILLHYLAEEASEKIAKQKAREKIAALGARFRDRSKIKENALGSAATNIQRVWKVWKGYLGRKEADKEREARDAKAAITIQAAFRGSLVRRSRIGQGEETLGEYLRGRALGLLPPGSPLSPSASAPSVVPAGSDGASAAVSVASTASNPAAVAPDASALADASAAPSRAPATWSENMTIDEYMSYVGPESSQNVARLNGNGSNKPIWAQTATGFATYDGEKDGYKAFSQDVAHLSALRGNSIKYLPALITNPAHNKAGVYAMVVQDSNGVTRVFGGSELLGEHESEKHYKAALDEGMTGDDARREAVRRAQEEVIEKIKEGQQAVNKAKANPNEIKALLAGFPDKQQAAIKSMLSKNVASYGNNTTSIAIRGNNSTIFFTENGDPHVYLPIPGSNGNAFLRASVSRGGKVQVYKDGKPENVEMKDGEVYFDESTVWALGADGKHVAIGIGNTPSIAGTTKAAKMAANAIGVAATVFTLGLAGGAAKCLHQNTDSAAIKGLGIDSSILNQGIKAMRVTATSHTRSLGISLNGKTTVKDLNDVAKHAKDEHGDELVFKLDRMGLPTSSKKLYPLLDEINGIKVFAEISYGKDGPVVNPRLFAEFPVMNPVTGLRELEKQEIKKSDLKTMVKEAETSSSEVDKQENLAKVDVARAHLRKAFTVNVKQDIGDGKSRYRVIAIKAQLSRKSFGAITENSDASTKKRGIRHDDILIDVGTIEAGPSRKLNDCYALAHKIEDKNGNHDDDIELRVKISHDLKNKASVDGQNFYIEKRVGGNVVTDEDGNPVYEPLDQAKLLGEMAKAGFKFEEAKDAAKFAFEVLPDVKFRFQKMQGHVPVTETVRADPPTRVGKLGRKVSNLFTGREANQYSSLGATGGRGAAAA